MSLDPITIDFETQGIEARPKYPPEPVGVALWEEGSEPRYLAWGHPTGNNCTKEEGVRALREVWASGAQLLFQNAAFDLAVANERLGLPLPTWERNEDTMYLLFLDDPHAPSLSLKPSAERLLGMPPDEQDAVRDWLVAHKVVPANSKQWGAHIAKAPGDLVGKYAVGDVVRTRRLFDLLWPRIIEAGMGAAYDRERRLLPVLMANEREGMRVDCSGLERDIGVYRQAQEMADGYVRETLGVPGLNIDSDRDLADALERTGIVTEWEYTAPSKTHPKGQKRTAKDCMTEDKFTNPEVAQLLGYRNKLQTYLSTFMEPWLEQGTASGGRIYTRWNQVKDGDGGARTGRPSTDKPNLLNVPKRPGKVTAAETKHGLPPIPNPRTYILPDEGHVWLHRDYSAQEPRLLAHFEGGAFMRAFQENPRLDPHTFVASEAGRVAGMEVTRDQGKVLNLALSYGMGQDLMARKMGVPKRTAQIIKAGYWAALPDMAEMDRDIKFRLKSGQFITTWGGRRYYVQPGGWSAKHKKFMSYEYKGMNILGQGSAADVTKEAMIRYYEARGSSRLLVSVYDEVNVSSPAEDADKEMEILREAMESVECDVPLLTEGKRGLNWGGLR